jgi:hypothetical protein
VARVCRKIKVLSIPKRDSRLTLQVSEASSQTQPTQPSDGSGAEPPSPYRTVGFPIRCFSDCAARYNGFKLTLGCFMERLRVAPFQLSSVIFAFAAILVFANTVRAQGSNPVSSQGAPSAPASSSQQSQMPQPQAQQAQASEPPISPNAPRMSKQTRFEVIRDFETQIVYARAFFPMGAKGVKLKDGVTTPNGPELQQAIALWGPAVRPGDPAHISYVQIKDDHIHFDLNGGPVHRKKWYEHVTISGANAQVPLSPKESQPNPHGTYLDVYFNKYVPEMTAQQLRDLLYPVLDFKARNKEEAYLDTVPPKVKTAIQAHYVLVGMNTEMVLHAKGKAPKKVREKDGDIDYEEWIYGDPPQDVDFVRIVGDEVVRVETMKVGGQKIVRNEKEVILERPDKDTEAKQEDRPPNAPSLRRPGEDSENAPKPSDSISPVPVAAPRDPQQPTGSPGPGDIVAGRR